MKFRCERDVLADALTTAGRAATSRTGALPVLEGLHLALVGDELSVTGTDLDMSIRLAVTVGGASDGAVVVPARLSADAVNISGAASSTIKGETLIDTARNLEAMKPDVIVVRHACSGAAALIAERLARSPVAVINAGDGTHEHPSQALLDAATIRKAKGKITGLEIAIVGDIDHSRVARSNLYALSRLGASLGLGYSSGSSDPISQFGALTSASVDTRLKVSAFRAMYSFSTRFWDPPPGAWPATESATAIAPTEPVPKTDPSLTDSQLMPPSVVFQTPPPVEP